MLRFAFTWKPVTEMNWRVMFNFVSSVVAFFIPIFNAWCFVPFNKELDWEWKEKKTPGNQEAEETNSPGVIHPMCQKKKKIGVLDFKNVNFSPVNKVTSPDHSLILETILWYWDCFPFFIFFIYGIITL